MSIVMNFSYSVKKKLTTYCHIHFFGDNGRWCWMNINCLMPYRDRNDLKRLKEERNAVS